MYTHYVWRTWDRLLVPETRRRVCTLTQAKCQELRCRVEALDRTEGHVHLVVDLAPKVAIAKLAKRIKGASSHLATHEVTPDDFFKWAYFATSINQEDLPIVVRYVKHQQQRHRERTMFRKWECPDD